jgi:hypothetical protein
MNRFDQARYDDYILARFERAAEIKALQVEHNRCAWCGVAVVDAGQPYCLTHVGRVPA